MASVALGEETLALDVNATETLLHMATCPSADFTSIMKQP